MKTETIRKGVNSLDAIYLEYLLKKKGIPRDVLAAEMKWSSSTCQRRCAGSSDWSVEELKVLMRLGFDQNEINRIFFTDSVLKVTQTDQGGE